MSDSGLELRAIRRSFGELVAVDDLSFSVPPGRLKAGPLSAIATLPRQQLAGIPVSAARPFEACPRFKQAIDRAEVHRITFHELRHTFGTRMAAAGTPTRTLQPWMGHADSKTTQIYAHYQPSDRRPTPSIAHSRDARLRPSGLWLCEVRLDPVPV